MDPEAVIQMDTHTLIYGLKEIKMDLPENAKEEQ